MKMKPRANTEMATANHGALDQLCINTIRTLSMDADQAANSGHPGTPMALAPVSGVEATTGPLGQGISNAFGMAIAGGWLDATYNRPDFPLFDHDVYALCSDGDLMEGVSSEAASLAGHLRLANLCWIYDKNHITIEGNSALAYSDHVATRFIGHGWNVTRVTDANDLEMLSRAFATIKTTPTRPIAAAIDEAVPTPVLSAALYERFSSRYEADFADTVMRFEFGGHPEKGGTHGNDAAG
jgi:transketolase